MAAEDSKMRMTDVADTRKELEARTGKKVVTALTAKSVLQLKKNNDNKNK